ncbi:MAG: hypothetical protein ACOQNV_01210 [Mycoplasmoidaceae bacterium]
MKKSKLLFLTPCLTVATIAPVITSCGGKSEAEQIADYIFGPLSKDRVHIESSFQDALKGLSSKERQKEQIYDLFAFGFSYFASAYGSFDINELNELYKNNTVGIKSNITQNSLNFDGDTLKGTFLGYVSFVFQKNYSEIWKTNDYIMFTFNFFNIDVQLNETKCSFLYKDINTFLIGILELRNYGGTQRHTTGITQINTLTDGSDIIPYNSNNWYK